MTQKGHTFGAPGPGPPDQQFKAAQIQIEMSDNFADLMLEMAGASTPDTCEPSNHEPPATPRR
jgi:hypothetical protein